jgi:tetratricopeptide (TPR) repeat protein
MSLLMEALKRAEREKHKVDADESTQEESRAELTVEPNGGTPTPEPLQEGPFPFLEWVEPTPGDSAPAAMAFPAAPVLSLEARTPEPAPGTATAIPPVTATGPAFNATQPQSAMSSQDPAQREAPAPGESPLPRTAPPLQNGTPSAIKQPQETMATQRQQHAANILAATTKTSDRNRLLPAAVGTAAILLVAGGAYLYWQYPQLSSVLDQGGLHPAPIASPPPPVVATMAPVASSQLPEPLSSPPPMLTAAETAASNATPADERQTPPPPTVPLVEQAPKESAIAIRRSTHKEQVAPALARGYSAFMAGNDSLAQQEYTSILRQDGNNRDALLGMAAIAAKRGHSDEAVKTYLRLQELDPRDAAAQAGILALTAGQADPVQSESRVKTLLAQQPDAHFLHFALGNLYAGQSRWAEAQQAFFHAYQKAPSNPDYLYNLAISLDHLNQGKLALEYYQRALALSQSGSANFDKAAAQNRAKELHTIFHGLQPVESRSPLGLQPAGN